MAQGRILIIDGDVSLSEILKTRLKAMGYLVDCAHNGNTALDTLNSKWVDLIVLAVTLQGGMHGFHLLKEIKRKKAFTNIPIVMQSSKPAMKKLLLKMGAEAFFIKPYSVPLFLNKIKHILTKQNRSAGNEEKS